MISVFVKEKVQGLLGSVEFSMKRCN